jgi:hypothetical protein
MQIFSSEIDVVDFIVRLLETVQVMPEDYVIKQGQKATCMYFLA